MVGISVQYDFAKGQLRFLHRQHVHPTNVRGRITAGSTTTATTLAQVDYRFGEGGLRTANTCDTAKVIGPVSCVLRIVRLLCVPRRRVPTVTQQVALLIETLLVIARGVCRVQRVVTGERWDVRMTRICVIVQNSSLVLLNFVPD